MSSDYTERIFAADYCHACGVYFGFDAETVPSVWIDPITNKPPDQLPPEQVEDALERAVKRPVCPDCVNLINPRRNELGLPPL